MNADRITIEWDEDGCYLLVHVEDTDHSVRFRLTDPEQAYDAVKGGIGPWLRERDEARAEYEQYRRTGTGPAADYFACKDPEGDWIRDMALSAMAVSESLEASAAALDSIDLRRKAEKER